MKPCCEALAKGHQAKDPHMSEWRDISTAPRDGVFVLLHNDNWASDVEGFWHKGSHSWSANTRIPGIENRVISPEPPTHWKPLTVEEEKY